MTIAIRAGPVHRSDVCVTALQSAILHSHRVVVRCGYHRHAWKFLKLQQTVITLDVKEYYIDNAGKILGILTHILQNA